MQHQSRKEDNFVTPKKKLRFRGDLNLHHFNENRLEDIIDESYRTNSDETDGKYVKGEFLFNFLIFSGVF